MRHIFPKATMLFVAMAVLVCVGCSIPSSKYPLSDEKTSKLDERLLGVWESVPESKKDESPAMRIVIGRKKKRTNTLETVHLQVNDTGYVKVHRIPLYTTKIGGRTYMSWGADKKHEYVIYMYELADEKTGRLYMIDGEALGDAIQAGEIQGEVTLSEQPEDEDNDTETVVARQYKSVHVTEEPAKLAKFISKNVEKCFDLDAPGVFRKIDGD